MSTKKLSSTSLTSGHHHHTGMPIIKLSSLWSFPKLLFTIFLLVAFFASSTYLNGESNNQVTASPANSNLQSSPIYRRALQIKEHKQHSSNNHNKSPIAIDKAQNDSRSQCKFIFFLVVD